MFFRMIKSELDLLPITVSLDTMRKVTLVSIMKVIDVARRVLMLIRKLVITGEKLADTKSRRVDVKLRLLDS